MGRGSVRGRARYASPPARLPPLCPGRTRPHCAVRIRSLPARRATAESGSWPALRLFVEIGARTSGGSLLRLSVDGRLQLYSGGPAGRVSVCGNCVCFRAGSLSCAGKSSDRRRVTGGAFSPQAIEHSSLLQFDLWIATRAARQLGRRSIPRHNSCEDSYASTRVGGETLRHSLPDCGFSVLSHTTHAYMRRTVAIFLLDPDEPPMLFEA